MAHPKLLPPTSLNPKSGRAMGDCLSILLDEIRLAVAWSRPSILVGVHPSKLGQEKAIDALERKLTELSMDVEHVTPGADQIGSLVTPRSERTILFIQGLGQQKEVYDELNLHREKIIERRLKVIFWLSTEELVSLSHQAPDFWAFRHRVVEFPTSRGSAKNVLPSGSLLWQVYSTALDLSNEKKSSLEQLLQNLPNTSESLLTHVASLYELSHLYWCNGENQKSEKLLHHGLEYARMSNLKDMVGLILNGLSIISYDRGEYQQAMQLIKKALEAQPNSSTLWANHGIFCQATGKKIKSLPSLNKALRIDPTSSPILGVQGYFFMSMGKYHSALARFEKALNLNPDNDPFQLALAVCHYRIGDRRQFETTLRLISASFGGHNTYLAICREGLLGNRQIALSRLRDLATSEKIPAAFLRRDPTLYFVFGAEALMTLLQGAS